LVVRLSSADTVRRSESDGAADGEADDEPLDDGVAAEVLAVDVVLAEPVELESLS
jgi:hypothetical protein